MQERQKVYPQPLTLNHNRIVSVAHAAADAVQTVSLHLHGGSQDAEACVVHTVNVVCRSKRFML